jgi:hypothetical protein
MAKVAAAGLDQDLAVGQGRMQVGERPVIRRRRSPSRRYIARLAHADSPLFPVHRPKSGGLGQVRRLSITMLDACLLILLIKIVM